ncbi:hypothetical protein DFQ30_006412 [Apophysomyces sp. BC1015]|nr:hypothetical protein DFQ30_006412 [Apophysomyces sp. BC1015]
MPKTSIYASSNTRAEARASSRRQHQRVHRDGGPSQSYRDSETHFTDTAASQYLDHAELDPETRLSKIAMLGTHDAGTYMFSRARAGRAVSLGSLVPGAFKCQSLDLVEQAKMGVRYFDIRVVQDGNGIYRFFHGPSKAAGDALSETIKLLNHASADKKNFYICKFHFEKEDAISFLEKVIENVGSSLIKNTGGLLGDVTIGNSIVEGRNIAAVVHKADTAVHNPSISQFVWNYKDNISTKWGNVCDGNELGQHIRNFYTQNAEGAGGKISHPPRFEKLAQRGHEAVANVIEDLAAGSVNPGVISIDYAGKSHISSTRRYSEMIKNINSLLKRRVVTQL